MKIKTTFGAIHELGSSPFFQQLISIKFSDLYVAYKVQRILKKVLDYYGDIEKRRLSLVDKYGIKVLDKNGKETGKLAVEAGEQQEKYFGELHPFFARENEFDFECFLDLEDLRDNIKLSVYDITLLKPILDEKKIEEYLLKQETENMQSDTK
jgi:hypothetical protein